MGSFFRHNDYRLPDLTGSLSYKKDNSGNSSIGNPSTGIFENNPCFASIKKELGFLDGDNSNGVEDIYADMRARSSPVVERLILQEVQNDIADYSMSLGVPMNPEQWNTDHTRKWLRWVAESYNLGDLSECLLYDGATLCNFSEQEFTWLTGSADTGQKIAAQLDLWKNAIRMTPSAGSYHFQQQQAMDFKFGMPQCRQSNSNTPKLLAASCSWSTSNQQTVTGSGYSSSQYNNPTGGMNSYNYNYPPQFTQSEVGDAAYTSQPMPQVRYPPRPTIPLDRFSSYRSARQSENFSLAESYQRYTDVGQVGNFNFPAQLKGSFQLPINDFRDIQQQQQPPQYQPEIKGYPPSLGELPKEYLTTLMGEKTYTVDPQESLKALAILSKPAERTQPMESKPCIDESHSAPKLSPYPGTPKKEPVVEEEMVPVKMEKNEATVTCSQPSSEVSDEPNSAAKPARKKSSKHPIHLWQFLKQLLNEGKDCIRWLDQDKGVFKIYNSQQVAKYWGEKKNRPAMNYDKLSRSIRQYYKKGIIKKTSQGKRLVYQFCEAYM